MKLSSEEVRDFCISKYGLEYWDKCMLDTMKDRIRTRTRYAFKRISKNKPTKTENLLGCTWLEAKEHLEKYFTDTMNWSNIHEWHIDHIIPLSSASNKQELSELCKYTNLQPLMAADNLRKSNKRIARKTVLK